MKHVFVSRLHRTAIALGATLLVGGCTLRHAPILDPKGLIALAERDLLIPAAALMLMVLIPAFVMAFLFSWSFPRPICTGLAPLQRYRGRGRGNSGTGSADARGARREKWWPIIKAANIRPD